MDGIEKEAERQRMLQEANVAKDAYVEAIRKAGNLNDDQLQRLEKGLNRAIGAAGGGGQKDTRKFSVDAAISDANKPLGEVNFEVPMDLQENEERNFLNAIYGLAERD